MSAGAGAGAIRLGSAFVEVFLKSMVEKDLSQIGAQFKSLAASTLTFAAVEEAIRRSITAFVEYGSQINRVSEMTGVAATTLSQMAHAAQLSETDLGGLQHALTLMQRNLGSAEGGAEAAAKKFERFGISIEQLRGKDAAQQMMIMADAVKAMPTATERTAAAMALFGRSGASMLPFLKEGSAGIKAMMKDADALGLTLDQRTARKADAADDAFVRLGNAVKGLAVHFGAGLTPAIKAAADNLTYFISKITFALDYYQKLSSGGAWKETERNAQEQAAFLERAVQAMPEAARMTPEEADKKEKTDREVGAAKQEAAMRAFSGDVKLAEAALKSQWDSGAISMEQYYSKLFENQKGQLEFEISILKERERTAADEKERIGIQSQIAAKQTEIQLAQMKMNSEVEKDRKEKEEKRVADEKKRAQAVLEAGRTVSGAEDEASRARMDARYESERRRIAEMKEAGTIGAQEAFDMQQRLDEDLARQRAEEKRREIDANIEYEQGQLEQSASAEEAIKIRAAIKALEIKRGVVGVEEESNIAEIAARRFKEAQVGAAAGDVVGTFSGALAGKAGFGSGDVFTSQLNTMRSMDTKLTKIADNTQNAGGLLP